MRGDLVIARALGNKPIVRRVWDFNTEKVYICTEEKFGRLMKDPDERYPMGFPRQDVFCYDSALYEQLERNPSVWQRLTLWREAGE